MKMAFPTTRAKKKVLSKFNRIWVDDFEWLKDRDSNPEIDLLIGQENMYASQYLESQKKDIDKIFSELKSRIIPEDKDIAERIDEYFYYSRTERNKEYPLHCRRYLSLNAKEEIYFDENEWAKNEAYFELGSLQLSFDHNFALCAVDYEGEELYQVFLLDLNTKTNLKLPILSSSPDLEWGQEGSYFYFLKHDENSRPFQCYQFDLVTSRESLVFEESRKELFLGLSSSKDEKYIFIEAQGNISSEVHCLSTLNRDSDPRRVKALEQKVEYYVEHHESEFLIISNHKNKNFGLFSVDESLDEKCSWKIIYDAKDDELLVDFEIFKNHLVLYKRSNALDSIVIYNFESEQFYNIDNQEDCYEINSGANSVYDCSNYHFEYSSMSKPYKYYSLDLNSLEKKCLKEFHYPNFHQDNYATKRIWVDSHDNKKIPVSLLFHKNFPLDNAKGLYLSAYGAYGLNLSCGFNKNLVSLVDRGVVIAMAHVRGGSEMGTLWYEDGKLLNKMNSFLDTNTVAQYFVSNYSNLKDKLVLSGGSAGGLLVGACINERPDLYCGAVLNVPFLDVVNTMLDTTQALTALEYDEWGNPNIEEFFEYIFSYSPYENIKAQLYPSCLVIAGVNDSRVKYWEPLKWIQKLRNTCLNPEDHYLQINTEAGHSGSSGRYEGLKEIATEFLFVLKKLDIEI